MGAGKIAFALRFPVGVVAAITPFNAPFNLACHKVAPAIAAERAASQVTVYASWNGATEVRRWQVLAGPDPEPLTAAGSAPRRGFETAVVGKLGAGYVAAQALDAAGTVLGTSRALKI